jgi:DNA-binding winged helix-turn-helix (wHTH) protein
MAAEIQAVKPRIDLSRYQLTVDGRRVKLERQPMELLIFFVQRKDQLVIREDIVDKLWGQHVFVDVDRSINSAVRKIRTALRDDPANPRYLETVVGKGYRFTGDVELVDSPATTPQRGTDGSKTGAVVASSPWRARQLLILLVAVVLVAFAWWWIQWQRPTAGLQRPKIQSLAVLPLANLSGDPSQDYFADGMTDELITELAKIRSLRGTKARKLRCRRLRRSSG